MKTRKLLGLALALCMMLALAPVTAHAATVASGKCGTNATWVLADDGTLTVSGSGTVTSRIGIDDYARWYPKWDNWETEYDEQVKKVVVQSGITELEEYTFDRLDNLTTASLPATLNKVGINPFSESGKLQTISVNSGNTTFTGGRALINKTEGRLVSYAMGSGSSYTTPSGVSIIGRDAFYQCQSLTELVVSEGVTTVENYGFACCENLKKISLPGSLRTICDHAFADCGHMGSCNDPQLAAFNLPEGVVSIGKYSFANCKGIYTVNMPDSLKTIGDWAFMKCSNTYQLTIPKGVTEVGYGAFDECYRLTDIQVAADNQKFCSVNGILYNKDKTTLIFYPSRSYETFTVPSTVTALGDGAFCHNINLTTLTVPGTVRSIGKNAFFASDVETIVFRGSAPTFGLNCFSATRLTARYPGGDSTWTEDVRQDYGGETTWEATAGIVTQPADKTVAAGETARFTVKAVGTELTYQWQYRNPGESAWNNSGAAGAKTATLQVTAKASYNGTSYRCVVTDTYGYQAASNAARLSVRGNLAAPKITSASGLNESGKPTLKWNAVSGASKYVVYRANSSGGTYTKMYTTNNTSYTNTGANAGYTYYYKVCAVDGSGLEGALSAAVGVHCRVTPPKISSGNTAYPGKRTLAWDAVKGAKEYVVYRANSSGGTYTKMYTTTGTTYTNTSAKPGYTYYYKVYAVDAKGYWSVASAAKGVRIRPQTPSVTGSTTDGKPTLRWSAVSGAREYVIYRATSQNGGYSKYFTTVYTSFTNGSAEAGKTYWYKVYTVDKDGYWSLPCDPVSIKATR